MQSLQQRMWQEEVAESAVQGQAARMRRAAAEEEEREAVRELDRMQAEGPANHRKRDPIDKVRRDSCRATHASHRDAACCISVQELCCETCCALGFQGSPA